MTAHNPATCPCGGHSCDACHAVDPGYSPPWGWSLDGWDEYAENSLVRALMPDAHTNRVNDGDAPGRESLAWCIMVIVLSTAAMAILSEEQS